MKRNATIPELKAEVKDLERLWCYAEQEKDKLAMEIEQLKTEILVHNVISLHRTSDLQDN
jgi:hypothetical protein